MFDYELVRSNRKTIAVQVKKDGNVVVRAPRAMSKLEINYFLRMNRVWIDKHVHEAKENFKAEEQIPKLTREELMKLALLAKEVIPGRVEYYAGLIGVTYGRITIRAQKTRWGSCSAKGNLNFNCLLMAAPPEVLDSVVVHELCHRKHMDHSKEFYEEIYKVYPDYKRYHKWLKENGAALMASLPE